MTMPIGRGGHNKKTQRNQAICADWQAGMAVKELSAKYGIKPQRIYVILGPVRKKGTYRLSQEETRARQERDEGFVRGWNDGREVVDMAEEAGVTTPVVYDVLREARSQGRLLRTLGPLTAKPRNTALINDWNLGMRAIQLRDKYGISEGTVYRIIATARKRYGDRIRTTERMREIERQKKEGQR